ncbi:hypothetical protein HY041_02950, partial [Candidatus Roizmanbacteria bacterium]|nr:hypothetical protein [Candidatus Roizmanbacteria bacterium]
MSFLHEPLFEPVARNLRFQKGIKEISRKKPIIMVDLGCGPKIRFYHFAKIHGIQFKKYIGIDPLLDFNLLQQYKKDKIVQLKKNQLNKKISLPSASVDYIVAFASIEHFNSPIQ